ncbi:MULTISPECIES: sugar O-acetyltransferase [unclassified Corynebacterium]|uniref:sugar O-acetyltransferase n=1 Tax=unclassified Corynebacterium TaxID=2624378 RepID=UPI0029CA4190|nr:MULTISPECIES: sugar O-acetyltransferase [unclassified Corynebacterium]WPF66221.1 sugar O-acetyltransferase [Corynebacterium sp. 22KM0430]WPF68711.1 sugar O-acetyltransferase [Corynebacterium sp. 21KM1197]
MTHPATPTTSLEQMASGAWHLPGSPELTAEQQRSFGLLHELNALDNTDPRAAREIIRELTRADHATATVIAPASVEYGCHLRLGRDVFINMGVTVLSSAPVTIGERTLIGPNCQFLTVGHPVDDVEMRAEGWEQALPITVGADTWIGAGTIVLPGVSIGDRVTIGAGSLVTRNIPDDAVALGHPARVVRMRDRQRADAERAALPQGQAKQPQRQQPQQVQQQ